MFQEKDTKYHNCYCFLFITLETEGQVESIPCIVLWLFTVQLHFTQYYMHGYFMHAENLHTVQSTYKRSIVSLRIYKLFVYFITSGTHFGDWSLTFPSWNIGSKTHMAVTHITCHKYTFSYCCNSLSSSSCSLSLHVQTLSHAHANTQSYFSVQVVIFTIDS